MDRKTYENDVLNLIGTKYNLEIEFFNFTETYRISIMRRSDRAVHAKTFSALEAVTAMDDLLLLTIKEGIKELEVGTRSVFHKR